MEKFDLSQIKAGYLLVVKDTAHTEPFNMTVSGSPVRPTSNEECLACCCPGKEWWLLSRFDQEGKWMYGGGEAKIMAVYGVTWPQSLLDNSTEHRKLLWERKELKKMTVAEICEALGYDVEIVKEGKA